MNAGLKKLRSYLEREALQHFIAKLTKFQVSRNHVSVNKEVWPIYLINYVWQNVLKCQV